MKNGIGQEERSVGSKTPKNPATMSHITITITLPEHLQVHVKKEAVPSTPNPVEKKDVPMAPVKPQVITRRMPKLIDADAKSDANTIVPFSHLPHILTKLPTLSTFDLQLLHEQVKALILTKQEPKVATPEHSRAARSLYEEFYNHSKPAESKPVAAPKPEPRVEASPKMAAPLPAVMDPFDFRPEPKVPVAEPKVLETNVLEPKNEIIQPASNGHCDCEVKQALETDSCPNGMTQDRFRKIRAFRDVMKRVAGNEKYATCSMFASYETWCEKLSAAEKAHLNRYQRMMCYVTDCVRPLIAILNTYGRSHGVLTGIPDCVIDEVYAIIQEEQKTQ